MNCTRCHGALEWTRPDAARCLHCSQPHTFGDGRVHALDVEVRTGGGLDINVSDGNVSVDGSRFVKRQMSRLVWALATGAFALVLVAGIAIYVVVVANRAIGDVEAAQATQGPTEADWDGRSTFKCSGNDDLIISDVEATLNTGTAILATANCKLTIVNSTINAPIAVESTGNAKVEIRGGKVTGKQHSIVARGNARVLVGATTLAGKTKTTGLGRIDRDG